MLSCSIIVQRLLVLMVLVASVYGFSNNNPDNPIAISTFSALTPGKEQVLKDAFENKRSNIQVKGQGIVVKILADDFDGSKHQRFIVKLSSGQTLLIAHNIDIAPRINSLQEGDSIAFYGEYEWNPQGGIIHWTHHDTNGNHVGGWLEHKGKRYQ
jgi:hypothetical protein